MRYCLFIVVLLLFAMPSAALVVDSDVTWQGEKTFNEDVRVMPGVTLTISPGAKLYFNGSRLEVAGNIVASDVEFSGHKWEGLLLKGNDDNTRLTGCVVKGAKTGVLVKGGSPSLAKLRLIDNKVGVELRSKAGGEVVGSTFMNNEKVGLFIKDGSTTAVVDCRFEGNGRYGAYLYRANPRDFISNTFVKNEVAMIVAYHGTDPVVEGNRFEQNHIAIQVDRAARPTIKGNRLLENRTGLYTYRRSDPVVVGNRFEGNDVGVLVAYSSYPRVESNDFTGNELAIKLEYQSSSWEEQRGANARASETASRTAFAGQGMRTVTEDDRRARTLDGTVNAAGNWWGEKGTAELAEAGAAGNPSFIHDGRDQATFIDAGKEYPLDRVTYHPWSLTNLTERAQ